MFDVGADREQRRPFLDGIRAVAVVAVLLFHAGVPHVAGGLLGVDVFFVLSGFLITSLLCAEHGRHGAVRLRRFWARRARRLLPGLVVLLLGVAVYARVFSATLDLGRIRADAVATLLYVANWHFIAASEGYFAQGLSPSPLLHTWSLAVEEQYYLVWPLVAVVVLRLGGRRALAVVAALGALASAGVMAGLAEAGASVDRLYYGTDTRAQALLLGSVLGAVASSETLAVVRGRWAASTVGRRGGVVAGLAGAAFLVWAFAVLGGQDGFLYRGGFLLVAAATGSVIVAVTSWPACGLARALSWRPLTAVGRVSYGLYLYHWPIFLAFDHDHTGLSGVTLLAVRLALTAVAATVSWRLIEEPIRRRRFLLSWRAGVAAAVAVVATVGVVEVVTAPVSGAVTAVHRGPQGRRAMPVSEVRALTAAHAFTSHPVRFVLLGDSVALTMRFGLEVDSVARYGVRFYIGAWLGCDLDPDLPVRGNGVVYDTSPGCLDWQTTWPRFVDDDHADVVGILLGRFELLDHYYEGRWTAVGQAAWDRHLTAELDEAISLVSAHGAKVVLYTAPYDLETEAPDGTVYPENLPSRTDAYNRLLRRVAAAHRGVVTLVDLNKILDPAGHYTLDIDGVRVRYYDGVHISLAGGEWLQPRLLPEIAELGLEAKASERPSARRG